MGLENASGGVFFFFSCKCHMTAQIGVFISVWIIRSQNIANPIH